MKALDKLEPKKRRNEETNERTLAFLELRVGAKKLTYVSNEAAGEETNAMLRKINKAEGCQAPGHLSCQISNLRNVFPYSLFPGFIPEQEA